MSKHVTLFHCTHSRSGGVLALLEELQADYELRVLDMRAGELRQPEYLKINPMGKVPAILHDGALVTEQVAIYIYLADLYAEAGMAPAIGDPLRGPYLRWIAFYGSCFEPALIDKSLKQVPPPSMSPYGDYDTVLATLTGQLEKGPYLLGDTYSAADVLWGSALNWTTMFELVPKTPLIAAYIERVTQRPRYQASVAKDAALLARQG
ncbi:glutathione S-transferase family protein [Oxalobacteraceae bacterium A2-2]